MYLWDAASRWNASFYFLTWLTFSQVAAFSSPGRGSLQQPSCLETSSLRQHYWFEIQQVAPCNWLDIKIFTYALYHSSLLTGTTGLAAGSPLGHLQICRFISPVEQHNHHSFDSTFCILWSSVGFFKNQLEHLPKESSPPHAPAGLWVAPGWYCLIWLILGMVMMITRKMTIMAILMIKTKHLLVSSGRSARLHSWSGKLWEEK